MATITERKGRWTAQIRRSGFSTSETFPTKAAAEAWAFAQEKALDAAQRYKPYSMREVLSEYRDRVTFHKKTKQNEEQMIRQLLRSDWVDVPIDSFTSAMLAAWRDTELKRVKPSTVSRHYDVVKAAIRLAGREWRWDVPVKEVENVSMPVAQQKVFRRISNEKLETLRWAADNAQVAWMRPVIDFALETAMRRSEITNLDWDNVFLDHSYLIVVDTKNGSEREVPLSPRCVDLLKAQHRIRSEGSVWGITVNQLTKCWQRTTKRAGVRDVRFHDLRHEGCSRLFELGLTPIEVASMTGHKTMSQLMRYSHANRDKTLKAMNEVLS